MLLNKLMLWLCLSGLPLACGNRVATMQVLCLNCGKGGCISLQVGSKQCCKEGKIPPSPYELRNIPFLRGLYSAKFHLLTFNFRFNTGFMSEDSPNLLLKREQLDNPHKPKLWNSFREKFQIEVIFSK